MAKNRFQNWIEALKSRFNLSAFGTDTPFVGGSGSRSFFLPHTDIDWAAELGDLWNVPGAAACYEWILKNFLQAPLCVQQRKGDEWVDVQNHPLSFLMSEPNSEFDGNTLWAGVLLSFYFAGDAYLGIDRNPITRQIELWYLPHFMVTPKRNKQTKQLYYEYKNGNNTVHLLPEQVIRFRNGIDPRNTLYGYSPLVAAARDGYVMQQDTTYRAKAVKNLGLISGLITPDASNPDTLMALQGTFRPEDVISKIREKTTGDKAGEPIVWDLPLKFQQIGLTPQDLMMETMSDRSESTIAACFGVAPQAVGLHVGRLSKTYANMAEAREASWEEGIIPVQKMLAEQLGRQLLPLVSNNALNERVVFDISEIRPLQPDLDAIWKRAREAFEAGGIDRYTYLLKIGEMPQETDRGVYATAPKNQTDPKGVQQ